jgi:hypothetical protein
MSPAALLRASCGAGDSIKGAAVADTTGNSKRDDYFASTRGHHAAPVQAGQADGQEAFSGVRGAHATGPNGGQAAAGRPDCR